MEELITYTSQEGRFLEIKIYKSLAEEEIQTIMGLFRNEATQLISEIYLRTHGYFNDSINYYFLGHLKNTPTILLWATTAQENQSIAFLQYLYIDKSLDDPGVPTAILEKATQYLFEQGVVITLLNTSHNKLYNSYREIGYDFLLRDNRQRGNTIMFAEKRDGTLKNIFKEERDAYWIERKNLSNGDLALLQLLYSSLNRELLSDNEAFLIKNYPQGIIIGNELERKFSKLFARDPAGNYPIFLNKVEMGNSLIRAIVTVKKRELPIERIVDFDFYFLQGFHEGFYNLVEEIIAELSNFPHIILEYRGFNRKKLEILKYLGFKEDHREEEYFLYQGRKIDISILRKKLP